jgi:transcriptional regulator with XRE-family HTH domain
MSRWLSYVNKECKRFHPCELKGAYMYLMATKKTDGPARDRIRAWLAYQREKLRENYPKDADFAEAAGLTRSQVSNLMRGKNVSLGLDTFLRMRLCLKMSLDTTIDLDPPSSESLRKKMPA